MPELTLFKNILVPVDLSELSGMALRCAAALAAKTGGKLNVLLVEELMTPSEPEPRWNAFIERVMAQERRRARARLEDFVRRNAPGASVVLAVERGLPADRILRAALRPRADLIVMGTHGRGGLRRLVLGSVTEAVLKGARVPVLAVRLEEEDRALDAAKRYRCTRVLCALDPRLSPWSDVALRSSGKLANAFGASLVALKVLSARDFQRLDDEIGMAEERERFEDQLPEPIKRLYPDLLERGGERARALLEETRSLRADLLVTGSGRRGRRHGLGSETARVLRLSPCPVLVVPD